MQRPGGSDGEDAGAGADVERMARPATLQEVVEGEEASARRAVMAGAEGQRRLDLDGDRVDGDARPVMAAMNGEAAGRNGRQALERGGDPILFAEDVEGHSDIVARRRRAIRSVTAVRSGSVRK